MLEKVDIAIIGAGVVGLAIAYDISRQTHARVVVVEKNLTFGQETSSRNSQVIHSGIYYPASMLKTSLCLAGRQKLYDFCRHFRVGHQRLGKLVVASAESEIPALQALSNQAVLNGVEAHPLSSSEVRNLEPALEVKQALWIPDAGIVDVHDLMQRLYFLAADRGVLFAFNSHLQNLEFSGKDYTLTTSRDRFKAEQVINCAGLACDAIPSMLGIDIDRYCYRIHPCKGEYYRLKKTFGISHLIYPLPSPSGLLGIHITPDMSGHLRLGPNAYDTDTVSYQIDARYRDLFYQSVHNFLPALRPDDIAPDFAGIRPRLRMATGALPDFVIAEEGSKGFPGLIDLIGIESPGLTSCLAIAAYVHALVF